MSFHFVVDVVIMRDLTLGVSKRTKTPLAGFENDASTCYDMIVMNLVSVVFDRMGVPPGPIRLQAETLLKGGTLSENRVRNEHGLLHQRRHRTNIRCGPR